MKITTSQLSVDHVMIIAWLGTDYRLAQYGLSFD